MSKRRRAEPPAPASRHGECFVIIPYRRRFEPVYRAIEKTMTGAPLHFDCHRAKDIRGGGQIMQDVLRGIVESEVVIADLTGGNPNVFYELGLAHALRPDQGKTILLTQNMRALPFDVSNYRTIEYRLGRNHPRGLASFRKELVGQVQAVTHSVYEVVIHAREKGALERHEVLDDHKLKGDDGNQYAFVLEVEWYGKDHMVFNLRPKKYRVGYDPKLGRPIRCELLKRQTQELPHVPYVIRLESSSQDSATFRFIHK